ncbi:hypothetical protein GCM10011504_34310 [Siccirubricoccus deserti]|nr:hypothetical protein GCM10011504_34310 [Siccirubricoccus deserti]
MINKLYIDTFKICHWPPRSGRSAASYQRAGAMGSASCASCPCQRKGRFTEAHTKGFGQRKVREGGADLFRVAAQPGLAEGEQLPRVGHIPHLPAAADRIGLGSAGMHPGVSAAIGIMQA